MKSILLRNERHYTTRLFIVRDLQFSSRWNRSSAIILFKKGKIYLEQIVFTIDCSTLMMLPTIVHAVIIVGNVILTVISKFKMNNSDLCCIYYSIEWNHTWSIDSHCLPDQCVYVCVCVCVCSKRQCFVRDRAMNRMHLVVLMCRKQWTIVKIQIFNNNFIDSLQKGYHHVNDHICWKTLVVDYLKIPSSLLVMTVVLVEKWWLIWYSELTFRLHESMTEWFRRCRHILTLCDILRWSL
jgi:hypothetical protein